MLTWDPHGTIPLRAALLFATGAELADGSVPLASTPTAGVSEAGAAAAIVWQLPTEYFHDVMDFLRIENKKLGQDEISFSLSGPCGLLVFLPSSRKLAPSLAAVARPYI